MVDKVSIIKRSEIMKAVRSRDSRIEMAFRRVLWSEGLRYRKNAKKYFGKPDLVFRKYRAVIFIDSCFWHGCREHCRMPASRREYWVNKIARNMRRDKEVNSYYEANRWHIIRIWEHDLNKAFEEQVSKVLQLINKN